MRIFTRYDLIPRQHTAYAVINGAVYRTPLTSPQDTSSAFRQLFYFDRTLSKVVHAEFAGIWTPHTVNSGIRLYGNNDFLAEVTNVNSAAPTFFRVDITDFFNAFVSEGNQQTIGIEIKDDGVTAAEYYLVGLNVYWGDS